MQECPEAKLRLADPASTWEAISPGYAFACNKMIVVGA